MPKVIVKGNLGGEGPIKPEAFDTENEALERAAALIDQYGPRIAVDIWLGEEAGQPFRDYLWICDWRQNKRRASN
jgi:hypothetical protein